MLDMDPGARGFLMGTIREKVARAIHGVYGHGGHTRHASEIAMEISMPEATAAIDAFLTAAAKEGWRMRPDEVTDEMINAGVDARAQFFKKTGFSDTGPRIVLVANHPAGTIYQAMLAASPEFEWNK